MSKFNLIPPYLEERLELIKAFGVKKFVLSFIVTVLECTVIFLVIYALMSVFVNYPVLGAIILSILLVLASAVGNKRKKRNDNKKKNL